MRLRSLLLAASLLAPWPAWAGNVNGLTTVAPIASSFCAVSSLSSAAALCTIPASAFCAYISVTGAGVNWRDDGTSATAAATGGQAVPVGGTLWYCGKLSALSFIQTAATAALSVSYYK